MTASRLYKRRSSTGIPDRTTSVRVSGVVFYVTASMDSTSNKPILYIDNDCRNNPEIQLDNKISHSTMKGIIGNIERQLRAIARRIVEDQIGARLGKELYHTLNRIAKDVVMRKYTVKKILARHVVLARKKDVIRIQKDKFDLSYVAVGDTVNLKIEIPYGISSQRRRDILDHHAEEARNGDI